ncbi:MAG: hypothetical protein H0V98_08320 [Chloroflexia bacterium]|nr:hypothetical protein [Chloroflexia bacterium]
MTDPTPQRDQPPGDDARPVMGDHPDLEPDDPMRTEPVQSDSGRSGLLIPAVIVLVIILVILGLFLIL